MSEDIKQPTLPSMQDQIAQARGEFNKSIFNLGRFQYELMVARGNLDLAEKKAAAAAERANEFMTAAEAELQNATTSNGKGLHAVPTGSDEGKGGGKVDAAQS